MIDRTLVAGMVVVALGIGSAAFGCDEKAVSDVGQAASGEASSAPSAEPVDSAEPAGSAVTDEVDDEASPTGEGDVVAKRGCPNKVDGADTAVKDTEKGVEMTITASAAGAIADIRARAAFIRDYSEKKGNKKAKHDGEGGGKGALGRCPIVLRDTKVTVSDVEGGSKFVIDSMSEDSVDSLRRDIKKRLAQLKEKGDKKK